MRDNIRKLSKPVVRRKKIGFVPHSLNKHRKSLVKKLKKLMKRQKQSKYGILFNKTFIYEEYIYIYI